MNKLWNKIIRVLLIIFAICLVFGGGMVLAGAALGGTLEDASVDIGKSLFRHLNRSGITIDDWDVDFDDDDDNDDDDDDDELASGVDALTVDAEKIRELEAILKSCDLNVKVSDGQEISVKISGNTKDQVVVKQDGDTLEIIDKRKNENKMKACKINLTVPRDFKFENVEIELGAGEVDVERLEAKKLELISGAGDILMQELIVHQEANVSLGAGKVVVEEATLGDTSIASGAGEASIEKCTLTGDLDMAAGVGDVVLKLTGDENDYNYNLNCGMGELKLFDKKYSSLGKELEIDNDAKYTVSLSGGMGNVKISKAK